MAIPSTAKLHQNRHPTDRCGLAQDDSTLLDQTIGQESAVIPLRGPLYVELMAKERAGLFCYIGREQAVIL